MYKKLTPALMVADVKTTVEFYKNILGFELVMALPKDSKEILVKISTDKELIFAMMKSDNVEIMFQEKNNLWEDVPALKGVNIGASVTFYIETEKVKELFEKLKGKVEIVKELHTTWYGMQEFYIKDCNGYILTFAKQAK